MPTEALMDGFVSDEDPAVLGRRLAMRYLPTALVTQWVQAKRHALAEPTYNAARAQRFIALRGRLIKALHDAGAGLTPFEALATDTRNVAAYFGTAGSTGTVERGKVADLVLLDGNPLADITNTMRIAGVMARGVWLSRADIDQRLAEIAAA